MRGIMLCYRIGTIICITVFASIFTGVIHTDIDTRHTSTLFPLILIFVKVKSAPQKSLKQ